MKTLSYLFLSFFIFGLASCSSDDDSVKPADKTVKPKSETILGKWEVSQFTMKGIIYDENATITFDGIANDLTGNDMTFHEDSTISGHNAPFNMDLKTVVDSMPFNYTQPMSSVMTHSGEWSLRGDTLYLQEDGSNKIEKFFIESLTTSTLKLSGDENSITTDSSFPAGSTFDVTITLER